VPETWVGLCAARAGANGGTPPVLRAGLAVPCVRVKRRQDASARALRGSFGSGGWCWRGRGHGVRRAACDESESRESLVDPPRVRGAMT